MITAKKKDFYKFKNKVDLTNRPTFGYTSPTDPLNNELYVYLNETLEPAPISKAITDHNLGIVKGEGYSINNVLKLF